MKTVYCIIEGGLGNQMFQYAAARNMSIINNTKLCLVYRDNKTQKKHEVLAINHCNIPKNIEFTEINTVKKKGIYIKYKVVDYLYKKSILKKETIKKIQKFLNKKGLFYFPNEYIKFDKVSRKENLMIGYFQSSKYFNENKKIIKNELEIVDDYSDKNKKIVSKIRNSESIGIHIRRGDYLLNDNFLICDKKYYENAIVKMVEFIKKPLFVVFSDDIEWVKNNITFYGQEVIYICNNSQFEDLKIMSECKNFIMSNSSYSWWGQYLSRNEKRKVIAPSIWVRNENRKDIYEKDWILMDL